MKKNIWVQTGEYLSLAFVLPSAVAVGYISGYLLDKWLGTHVFYIVFLLLGIVAGFYDILRKLQKDIDAENTKNDTPANNDSRKGDAPEKGNGS